MTIAGTLAPALGVGALLLTACSTTTSSGSPSASAEDGAGSEGGSEGGVVTLVTHDSWAMSTKVVAEFEERSGYQLEVLRSGDAGQVANKLVLTADNPLGDAVYGLDNTFATRVVEAGALAEHTPAELPDSAAQYRLDDAEADAALTPVDWADVCVNIDDRWFTRNEIEPPRTLDDLTDPAYRGLFVTPGAATSSPGFAFLLATIGKYGQPGWQDYWEDLVANDTRVVSGWSDAYQVDFTAGGGNGDRPIVLSYNSSPPFTIPDGGKEPTTSALLETCFRQVEYAGVLQGAENEAGARALVDFLTSRTFQEALPQQMYVFPVDQDAELPELWARWAEPAPDPVEVSADEISTARTEWIRAWDDIVSQ